MFHNVPESTVTKAVVAETGCDEKKVSVHQETDLRWRIEACGSACQYQCRTTTEHPDGICMRLECSSFVPRVSATPASLTTQPGSEASAPSEPAPVVVLDPRITPENDEARFRGAIQLDVGAFTYPAAPLALGAAGLSSQLGAQINDEFGIVVVPGVDIMFGSLGGLSLSSAVMFDYTLDSTWSFGLGPDFGVFAAAGGDGTTSGVAAGVNYGGRLRAAFYPVIARGQDGIRRKALSLALDVRMLGGPAGVATASTDTVGATASPNAFVLSPVFTLGYQAF